MNMDGGSDVIFVDAFDPAHLPFMLIIGVNVVIFPKFLVEVVILDFC